MGNNDFPYTSRFGNPKLLRHCGERNARLAMDICRTLFPNPEALLIAGESAGAFAAVGNAPLVAGYYPGCADVTVYADSAQIVSPVLHGVVREVWKIDEKAADYVDTQGDLLFNYAQYAAAVLGERVVFLRSNTIYDGVLVPYQNKINNGQYTSTPEAIETYFQDLKASETRFAESGLPMYSFVSAHGKNKSGLTQHTAVRGKSYYSDEAVPMPLVQWLDAAVNQKKYENVGAEYLRRGEGEDI